MEEQRPQKIKLEELNIEIVNSMHVLRDFKSYEKELVDFLIEDALDNQQKKISTTYSNCEIFSNICSQLLISKCVN